MSYYIVLMENVMECIGTITNEGKLRISKGPDSYGLRGIEVSDFYSTKDYAFLKLETSFIYKLQDAEEALLKCDKTNTEYIRMYKDSIELYKRKIGYARNMERDLFKGL